MNDNIAIQLFEGKKVRIVWDAEQEKYYFSVAGQTSEIAEGLHAIARIPQVHPVPKGNQNLYVQDANGDYIRDDFRHELALYVDGLLFTGCAHSGLENILAACPWPVKAVVGGFHLLDGQETEEELSALAQRLKGNFPETQFYTSHCTGDNVFEAMKGVLGEQLQSFRCGTIIKTSPGLPRQESRRLLPPALVAV